MCKLSVVIPVYNSQNYLKKCLDSVVNQTLKDIEIICVNDCSPDNSLDILKEYAQNDNRIKIIDFKENKGVSIARNTAMEQAKSEYIGFVDSDDWIDLDFYEKLYNKAVNTNSDIVKAKIVQYIDETKILSLNWDDNEKIKKNKSSFIYGFTTAIFKLKIIQENKITFPEFLHNFEDPYFLIQYIYFSKKIDFIEDSYYYYRKNLHSATNNFSLDKIQRSSLKILDLINSLQLEKEDYLIIYNHFYSYLLNNCENYNFLNDKLLIYSNLVFEYIKNAKYNDVIYYYYKKNYKNEKIKLIRQNLRKK